MPAYKIKRFPLMPSAPWLQAATQSCAFILAVNWCLQGARGMDRKELSFRLAAEALLAAGLMTAGVRADLALIAAHSANFTLNGQAWVCVRYCAFYRRDPAALERFLARAAVILCRQRWLAEAALIGSRGGGAQGFGPRSDLDLRLIFPPGPLAWVRTNLLLLRLRTAAFLRAIPLDLYAYDTPEALRRFDQRERLLVILDRQGRLAAAFPERVAR
jgi:hypothetical protein